MMIDVPIHSPTSSSTDCKENQVPSIARLNLYLYRYCRLQNQLDRREKFTHTGNAYYVGQARSYHSPDCC
ncbi:protein of unknown function (plasmid) [Cupriavidus taiwanensis]|nr:protein of unknown function [Cupriavidus taiwanensis]